MPWSVKPIRKSLDLSSDSIEPKTDLVKQNSDDEKVSVSSETSSFKRSSNTSESSVYDTDSDSSTFDSDKVSCSSSLRFRPVKMSPPVESSLLKRKLNRHRDSCHSSLDSDVDNLPFKVNLIYLYSIFYWLSIVILISDLMPNCVGKVSLFLNNSSIFN